MIRYGVLKSYKHQFHLSIYVIDSDRGYSSTQYTLTRGGTDWEEYSYTHGTCKYDWVEYSDLATAKMEAITIGADTFKHCTNDLKQLYPEAFI